MEWSCEFDEVGRFVRTAIYNKFNPERLIGFFSHVFNQPYWRPGTPLLIDLGNADLAALNIHETQVLKCVMEALKMRLGLGKLALLCTDEDRLEFSSHVGSIVGREIDREICVFLDEVKAVDWLTSLKRNQWPVERVSKPAAQIKDETSSSVPVS